MNWSEVVKWIQERGFSQNAIAEFCNCEQAQISLISTGRRGKNLSFVIGNALIEMKKLIESGELRKG